MLKADSLVFFEAKLYWFKIVRRNEDFEEDPNGANESYILTDGFSEIIINKHTFNKIRPVSEFNFKVSKHLNGYSSEMHKAGVSNAHTSSVFNQMVLEFVDKYSEVGFNEEAISEFNHLYGYRERLIALKKDYDTAFSLVR